MTTSPDEAVRLASGPPYAQTHLDCFNINKSAVNLVQLNEAAGEGELVFCCYPGCFVKTLSSEQSLYPEPAIRLQYGRG